MVTVEMTWLYSDRATEVGTFFEVRTIRGLVNSGEQTEISLSRVTLTETVGMTLPCFVRAPAIGMSFEVQTIPGSDNTGEMPKTNRSRVTLTETAFTTSQSSDQSNGTWYVMRSTDNGSDIQTVRTQRRRPGCR